MPRHPASSCAEIVSPRLPSIRLGFRRATMAARVVLHLLSGPDRLRDGYCQQTYEVEMAALREFDSYLREHDDPGKAPWR